MIISESVTDEYMYAPCLQTLGEKAEVLRCENVLFIVIEN